MTELAAISATFADWRTVKGRKQLQLIFEVPLEQQAAVLEYLGAPMPDTEKWVGIALLNRAPKKEEESSQPRATRTDGEWAVRKAGMLPKDDDFRSWLSAKAERALTEIDAADYIRRVCGVESRRALAANATAREKFWQINTQFEMDTGRMARPR